MMPNPNMTCEEYLQMFGTQEELESWKKKQEAFKEWVSENIPLYEPKITIHKKVSREQEHE